MKQANYLPLQNLGEKQNQYYYQFKGGKKNSKTCLTMNRSQRIKGKQNTGSLPV